MPMKTIRFRERSVEIARATITAHRGAMVKGLHKILAPGLQPGETMPDVDFLLTLIDRALDRLLAALKKAEREAIRCRAKERSLRRKRRELGKVLYRKVVELRDELKTRFGRTAAATLTGIHGNTPQGWRDLMHLGQHLEEMLSAPGVELPEPVRPTFEEPDPAEWIAQFHDETAELAKLRDQVANAARETDAAVVRKEDETDAFNEGFVGLADVLAALLRLIGYEEPARAVQPSKQDRGNALRVAVRRRKASASRQAARAAEAAEPEAASRPPSGRSGKT